MPMSQQYDKAFKDWISTHGIRKECPACGADKGWTLHNELLAGFEIAPERHEVTPSKAGFFALACKNCQYVMFFAAAPITEAKK